MNLLLYKKQYLHSLVYFVADKPAKGNLSPKIPLVGTASYKTLLNWCGSMNIDVTRVRMFNQCDNPFPQYGIHSLNIAIQQNHIKVVALGGAAQKYLLKAGVNEFYVLPHPSPKNRKLNDAKFIKNTLNQCREYIYKGVA